MVREPSLETEGFTVEVSGDGDDGFWRASEFGYDLIVLDIMLPRRNGYRVCSDLRAAGDWTPVLMLTAKDGDLDEEPFVDPHDGEPGDEQHHEDGDGGQRADPRPDAHALATR